MNQVRATDALRRPVIILVGHSGSGKSEVAINLALAFGELPRETVLLDLDMVKPYFRSRLVREELAAAGVELVIPSGDRLYADTPVVPPEVMSHLANHEIQPRDAAGKVVIADVGGNDNGARVVGSLSRILNPELTDVLFVVNANRPLTADVEAMSELVGNMSLAAGLEVTGLISNTHLMDETTTEIVRSGLDQAKALALETGVPLRFICTPELLSSSSTNNEDDGHGFPVLVLRRYILPPHARSRGCGPARVL